VEGYGLIPKSEYNYANKIALITLKALEEVMVRMV
jgi:hypothetical protein